MRTIRVRLKDNPYSIIIGTNLLNNCGRLFKRLGLGKDAVIITNTRLERLYKTPLARSLKKNGYSVRFERVADSERSKSADVASKLINRISTYDVRKQIFIIALGGGVVGDLAGFVAAIYKRGTAYVQIPTTLLAQVDSAIGGKVAIDLGVAKNLAGAFYQPRVVISDISLIKTLPARQIRTGLAEIIKYGVIKDGALFKYIETHLVKILNLDEKALIHIITRSSKIKASLVEKDEFDTKGIRAILNYGHTIGHAIEAASKYSNRYSHGEAIAIGMIAASKISVKLGMLKARDADRIEALIKRTGLPTKIKALRFADIFEAHLHDKKFIHGKNRFVLPTSIGCAKVVEGVPVSLVRGILKRRIVK